MNWGGYGMMGGGWSLWGSIFWLIVLIDLILVGVWLWKEISKK